MLRRHRKKRLQGILVSTTRVFGSGVYSQRDKLAFMTKGPGKKSESGYMELAEKH